MTNGGRSRIWHICAGSAVIITVIAGVAILIVLARVRVDGSTNSATLTTTATEVHDPRTAITQTGMPTGSKIEYDEEINRSECIDLRRMPEDMVALYRADCARAPLTLDAVQPHCSSHGVTVWRNRLLGYCFSWMVKPGDCVNLAEHTKQQCDQPAEPGRAPGPIVEIILVVTGERDGRRCPNEGQFLLAGRHNDRGVACYQDHDSVIGTRVTSSPSSTR